MERAELTAGPIEVRGSGAVHRVLSFLGAFFLGIGPGAQREREEENWWDRDEPSSHPADSAPMTLGHQSEMFDEAGHVAFHSGGPAAARSADVLILSGARPTALSIPQTIVSVHSKSRTTARVVATTRVERATRVAAVSKTATPHGAVARQLILSQSISSGREESRWFSVPQRVLLPRYQLFEGSDAVTENGGSLQIGSPSTRSQHGHVWFV